MKTKFEVVSGLTYSQPLIESFQKRVQDVIDLRESEGYTLVEKQVRVNRANDNVTVFMWFTREESLNV